MNNVYDVIIIGAGPAGMTAAIYAKRAKKNVLVFEKANYGGQIITTNDVENFPTYKHISGFEFAQNLYNQIIELGVEVKFEKVIDIKDGEVKEVITSDNAYKTKTIILATGADNRKLGIENEDKLTGKGISYCATCDGNFYKDKIVAVNGGGNTALEDAIYLSEIAKKVYLIHRRDSFRADEILVNELKTKSNIELILNSNIISLNGNDKLESIDIKNNDGNISNLKIDGLFLAIGRNPENQNFAKIINLDEKGYIIASEDCHTNKEGIFVAGDNRVKDLRQLVTATSDGAIAATEAIKYINSKKSTNL